MKRIFTFLFIAIVINIFAQNVNSSCGFNTMMTKLDKKYPDLRNKRTEAEARIRKMDRKTHLRRAGVTTTQGLYTGKVYEIPIVVHVIESNSSANANLKVTDQEIIDWVDRANKMFATTYGNGFYAEGSGPEGGAVMPFKLVLAKRSPSCKETNGIVRYNGSTLVGYDKYGVNYDNSNGVDDYEIKTELAPHWPESAYFNIYLITGFDSEHQLSYGLMGYATFPETYDYYYESWMKVATVKNANDTTLTHELGHAFGLYHTFDEIDYDDQTSCPVNNDCTQDGDQVCDTSPSRSMYDVWPVPSNSQIDPCTGNNWDGTQYNIMNYTNVERKFTEGQRERAVLMMLDSRSSLLNSIAGRDINEVIQSPVDIIAAQCVPLGINNADSNFGNGPFKVTFGSINHLSGGYDADEASPAYYIDYASPTCYRPAYYTDIEPSKETILTLLGVNGGDDANFRFKVWIDYNNNGTFEQSEQISNNTTFVESGYIDGYNITVTPPANAIKNKYLRMRVAVDSNTSTVSDFTACGKLNNGQMEDYAVRIYDETMSVSNVNKESAVKLTYIKEANIVKVSGIGNEAIGNFEIFDFAGKILQKGNSTTNEIKLNTNLPKGTYIVNFYNKGQKESKKFINQ